MLREVIELGRRHDLLPEVGVAGGAGDLGRVQDDVGRAADRHGDDDGVAQAVAGDDVARLQVLGDHLRQQIDQLGRELLQAARIVGRRRHHLQRLHADDADEGLHRVVGEHAAAAAVARAGVAGDVVAIGGVRVAGDLVGRDEVDGLAGLRVVAGMDGPVRHDDRRLVVLEQGCERADRRLVAGDDGDGAGEARRLEMLAERVVGDLAADQRVAHLAGAVADAVRRGDRVLGLHEAQLELVLALADAALQLLVDGLDLVEHAEIALAVALGADDADGGLVDQLGIGAELAGQPERLAVAARMAVDQDNSRVGHGQLLGLSFLAPSVAHLATGA